MGLNKVSKVSPSPCDQYQQYNIVADRQNLSIATIKETLSFVSLSVYLLISLVLFPLLQSV